ncbi:MAG: DUF3987 domain-containing protein [Bacteroides sp.]|nr:DUF3987 domain-containing protein [Bacteroides sp.]
MANVLSILIFFLFVTALASAGKGRLTLCRRIVEPVHRSLRDKNKEEWEHYKKELADYSATKKKEGAEQPQEPPVQMLFVTANSSATALFQTLNDNNGVGLMFETEGDTLTQTFKSEHGNYSDGFRKAFHHETISYNRRANREYVELCQPRLSVLLSGTPRQVTTLIPDAENGLFSRFLFYYMNIRLVWNDVFAHSDTAETLDHYFDRLGARFSRFYARLQQSASVRFSLTKEQQQQFNAFFEEVQGRYLHLFGTDILASIRRLGLITFRLAMILATLRLMEQNLPATIPQELVCSDADFHTAMTMVKTLLPHTAHIYQTLRSPSDAQSAAATSSERTRVRQRFFDALPLQFSRTLYLDIAAPLGISAKVADKYITSFCNNGKLERLERGVYGKK